MVSTQRLPQRTRVAAAMLVAMVVAALAAPAAATTGRWIVSADTTLPAGSTVVGAFPVANALVVQSPTAPAGGVSYDTPLELKALIGQPDADGVQLDSGVSTTQAPAVWAEHGESGEQAVVAVIDTGVAPVAALEGKVAGEINFTGIPGGGDGYGHGTFIASLIAGRGPVAPGVAPGAGILSLKVADAEGNASLGSVMSALQWLHSKGSRAGIRIATLALGVDPDDEAAPLLEAGANAVAQAGVLVVTASGNEGVNGSGNLSSPATATGTYSVGARNDQGTADLTDDVTADYSGSGPDRAGVQQPDAYAPGTSVVGSMPLNSVIGAQNPNARVGGENSELFRGTGTSMSTALAAGVAALASSARPDLTGAQLAAALSTDTGDVDASRAVQAALAQPQGNAVKAAPWADAGFDPSQGKGKAKGQGKGKPGNVEANGLRWVGLRWVGLRWVGLRWVGDSWTGLRWTGLRWTGLRWVGLRWVGDHWGDENWAFGKWAGLRWVGHGWEGDMTEPTFQGLRWVGDDWSGLRWVAEDWAGLRWVGLRWAGLRWAMLEAPAE